jgi:cyclopropane-fatty-acyl-phospholipid synthase
MTEQLIESGDAPVIATLANKFLQRALSGIEHGQIAVQSPTGQNYVFGREGAGARAKMHVHDWRFLWRLLASWDIGFAESYMAGEWSSPDLVALLSFMGRNPCMGASLQTLSVLRYLTRITHGWNRNTRRGSHRNIAAHYDLGNAFYEQWLDPGLTYSSAIYRDDAQSLHEAQLAKLDRIVQLLELSGVERVLEIGCGWGSLAERILEKSGCSVTALTLSSAQIAHARERIKQFEKSGRCALRLQDYRDAQGAFERVVSIEMLEAVGEAYWAVYFSRLRQRLTRDGIAVLQVITIAEGQFENYRRNPDFIQKYIFPGGMLPTVEILKKQFSDAGLKLVSSEFFGSSYARTLTDWAIRFRSAWPVIAQLGFDMRFRRMWEYYLAYCNAGFDMGALNVGLYKLTPA